MRRLLAIAALLLCSAPSATNQPMVVLSVRTTMEHLSDGSQRRSTRVEPIAFVTLKKSAFSTRAEFHQWPDRSTKGGAGRTAYSSFIEKYYRPGTKYRVYRGGVPDGFLTILPSDHNTCEEVQRRAEETSNQAVTSGWRGADAIAVGSFEPRPHAKPRRPPSAEENSQLRALARSAFLLKAVDARWFDQMQESDTAATDLDGDGHADLIGTFEVLDDEWRHQLFLVAVWDASGRYRADVVWYNRYPQTKDSLDAARWWSLVDYEDFDGDGIDEVIVEQHGWEWESYKILKRHHEGTWDVVYESDAFGC